MNAANDPPTVEQPTQERLPSLGSHEREEIGYQLQAVVAELSARLARTAEQIRARMDRLGELDPASQDVLIEVVRALEEQPWMMSAQLAGAR